MLYVKFGLLSIWYISETHVRGLIALARML